MMPKISVIIPTYNYSQYLPKAIKSVLLQDYSDYEIVVMDDCSKEDIEQLISKIDHGIRYFRNNHRLGPTLNALKGIEKSYGEFVCQLAADDLLPQGSLRIRYQSINMSEVDFVHGGLTRYQEWTGIKQFFAPVDLGNPEDVGNLIMGKLTNMGLNFATFLMNRKMIGEFPLPGEYMKYSPHDDFALSLLLAKRFKSVYVNENVYDYYSHKNSFFGKFLA